MAKEERLACMQARMSILSAVHPESPQSWIDGLNKDYKEYAEAVQGLESQIEDEKQAMYAMYEEVRRSQPTFTLSEDGDSITVSGV